MVKSNDAKIFFDITFSMNYVIIDQLALNLADICLHNTLRYMQGF